VVAAATTVGGVWSSRVRNERRSKMAIVMAPADAIAEIRAAMREQLQSAWRLHVERVEEQLQVGWREQIEHVFEERFADLTARLSRELNDAVARERSAAGRERTERLNRAARRLDEGAHALAASATEFARRAAVFSIGNERLRLESASFNDVETGIVIPLSAAPAFTAAIETADPVTALFSAGEISPHLADAFGPAAGERVYLFPIRARARLLGVLYAEAGEEPLDASALEILATLAGALWAGARAAPADGLVRIQALTVEPSWAALPAGEQEAHRNAQRFARVQVAGMRLYKSSAVKEGRVTRNLYSALGVEIDAAREDFRRRFVEAAPSMVDYLHVELLRTLANEDESLLGADYPGPLV